MRLIGIIITAILLSIISTGIVWQFVMPDPLHQKISAHVLYGTQFNTNVCAVSKQCLTALEISHLSDVRVRISWIYLCLPALLGYCYRIRKGKNIIMHQKALAIPIFAVIILYLNFENVFVILHKIIFPAGNWAFPASSLLIQIYPLSSWYGASVGTFVFFIVFLIIYLTKLYISGSMKIT